MGKQTALLVVCFNQLSPHELDARQLMRFDVSTQMGV
jgi:hypothetical protein